MSASMNQIHYLRPLQINAILIMSNHIFQSLNPAATIIMCWIYVCEFIIIAFSLSGHSRDSLKYSLFIFTRIQHVCFSLRLFSYCVWKSDSDNENISSIHVLNVNSTLGVDLICWLDPGLFAPYINNLYIYFAENQEQHTFLRFARLMCALCA